MDSVNGGHVLPQPKPESLSLFSEGIHLLFSQWTALKMAIENEWGGRDSRQKSEQLAADIFSWFSQSKGPLYIDDLENLIDESMVLSFNTEIQDGSVEEVAEKLMIMHEECLKDNYEAIEKLRKSNSGAQSVSQSIRIVNEDDDDESTDDEASDMVVDEPKPRLNPKPNSMSVDAQKPRETVEADDGWTVVAPKKNRKQKS